MLMKRSTAVTEDDRAAIPEATARALLPSFHGSWLTHGTSELAARLALAMPWLARARPEELFLPREFAQILPETGIGEVGEMMTAYAKGRWLSRPEPRKSAPRVGRNDPCTCGSGKKFKRCCATAT